ncbi:Sec-independent protein translocase subunit TatA/TatB [Winogradskyella endarachnes]|uniref:Sec-independent protein translocase protein TatA n=1 Tax=Winogradskyella endarachnes TaxID=2681965 RepID=A0A6L6U7F7_9FLAO|nr:twin-arginine translocase TatA/TatE family subunit [Winogradskyella endarachnes]MUU77949.1 twin-arginine translocase TatA/TatE family subunit [Winogradskyella endarachnes]
MIHQLTFLFIGGTEIVFVLLVVVLVFGADKLPEIARGLGKGIRQIKDATNDIKHEISNSAKENNIIDTDVTKNVKDELNKVKDDLEEFTGSLKRNK